MILDLQQIYGYSSTTLDYTSDIYYIISPLVEDVYAWYNQKIDCVGRSVSIRSPKKG